MSNLAAPFWNERVRNVSARLVTMIENLVEQTLASGYPPFTEPPKPDLRWAVYVTRPPDQWQFLARTEPQEALDQIRDFANMARRREMPEQAAPAARAVLAELRAEEMVDGY